MKKKLSDHLFTMIAIAIILVSAYSWLKPEVQAQKPGYAFLDGMKDTHDGLTPRLERDEPVEEIKPKEYTTEELQQRIASTNEQKEENQKQEPKKEGKKEDSQEEKKIEKTESPKEETIVKEEVISVPEEETIMMTNSQYIGNSGKVFMTQEEAESFAKKEAEECPDTVRGYQVVPSWEHPVDGNRQFTVDFVYQP